MVHYLSTADEWLQQSSLLLIAYPTSTKITTKYTIPNPSKIKSRKRKTRDDEAEPSSEAPAETSAESQQPVVASLTVRSFDPVSGACLQYKTSRGWEVGRIVANLGRLGRHMAALPEVAEDTTTLDVVKKEGDGGSRPHTPVPEGSKPATDAKAGQGGGGKKKKKGKK
ncbi:wd repeat [Venturia nashicola]|uniref:Wd repeat n=1 Tax=Venturia nashicola TaxID=86259 RepID=A0A4Z1PCB9_9PEZI|nr:wd repeat [Venturia nashicola]TLD29447.1 wd repeat [Venturia nashicola]